MEPVVVETAFRDALARLAPDELDRIWKALRELYAAADMTSFPLVSLKIINQLIPCHSSSYNEADLRTGAIRVFYEPDSVREKAESYKPRFYEYRHQHPLMVRYEQGLDEGVHKISDFIEEEEFKKLEVYREVLANMGVSDCLSFTLETTARMKVFYAINGDKVFSEHDRAVALVLQPHLVQAFENAIAFTNARALAMLATHSLQNTGEYGVALVDRGGRIIHANDQACRHLALMFPDESYESLPQEILVQLQWRTDAAVLQPSTPIEITRGDEVFVIRFAEAEDSHQILVTQRKEYGETRRNLAVSLELTERQAEIVVWLVRGKSNDEIGIILGLSERTVAKHLQRIFLRLGVENRRALMLRALPHLP